MGRVTFGAPGVALAVLRNEAVFRRTTPWALPAIVVTRAVIETRKTWFWAAPEAAV